MLKQNSFVKLVLVLGALIALQSCGGVEERKAKYLENAKICIADKNYAKARVELKNVLQIDPKTAEAYFLFGKIDDAEGEYNKSFGDYSRAVELNPSHELAREKLAHYYLMANDNAKADEMAEYILKKKPNDPEARTIHAVVLLKNGDAAAARKIAIEVINSYPSQIETIMLLSSLYERGGDMGKAIEVLLQGIAKNTTNINLPQALAELYLKQKDFIKAEAVLQKIILLEPDVLQHRINLSSFYAQINQPAKAEMVIREAIKLKPNDSKRYLILAEFLSSQNRGAEAETEILSAIKSYPAEYNLQYHLATYYQTSGKSDQAEALYRKIMAADRAGPDGIAARRRLADLLHDENKMTEAAALISEVLKDNPRDTQALMLKGTMELESANKKDWQAAIVDFRSILKDQPDSPEILAQLARAHELNDEPDLARESLQNAVKAAPKDASASLRLALFLLNNDKDVGGALRVLDQFLITSPNDLMALQGKLQIFNSKSNTKEIIDTLSQIKKTHPDSPVGYFHAGEFFISQHQYQEALHEFEQARDKSPGEFRAIGEIAKIYMGLDKRESAVKTLDDFLKGSPKNLAALSMKAEVLGSANESAEFFKVVDDIKRLFPDRADGFRLAGEFNLRHEKYVEACNEFKMATEKSPNQPDIAQSLLQAFIAAGKQDEALVWLTEKTKIKPNDGLYPYLIGEVLLSQKKYNEAEAQYQKSLTLMPINNQVYIRLADVRAVQNRWDESIKVLQQGLSVIPDDDKLRMRLASAEEITGHFDKALEIYEDLYWKDSNNYIVANNIASLLTDHKGDRPSLERALKLSSRFESSAEPALLDTLGWVYYKLNDLDHAIPLLKKAVDAAPKTPVLRYHLGMAYYKKGDKAAAKDNLTSAFASSEAKFSGADEGRAVLKSLQ